MNLQLEAMALDLPEVAGHPNRLPFRGVLTLVGVASQRAPGGAKGHRVMLTRSATDAALPSLLGMALDYAPSLDSHDVRRKIGIITEATVLPLHAGSGANATGQLAISGYLFAHDFPDVVDEIRAQAAGSVGLDAGHVVRDDPGRGAQQGIYDLGGDSIYLHRGGGPAAR